jgi:hypothetical protein
VDFGSLAANLRSQPVPADGGVSQPDLLPADVHAERLWPEYDLHTVAAWLARDPSLPWALFVSVCVYASGLRVPSIQTLGGPVVARRLVIGPSEPSWREPTGGEDAPRVACEIR